MRSRVRTRTHGSVGRRELRLPLTRHEGIKFSIYEGQGVKFYILVYPENLIAKIYQLSGEKLQNVIRKRFILTK